MSTFQQIASTFLHHRLGGAELMVGVVVALALLTSAVRGMLVSGRNPEAEAKLR